MENLFVYGTLCHLPLLARVLGRLPEMAKAHLPDHAVFWAQGHDFPIILGRSGAAAAGWLLSGLTPEDFARLDYYEGPFGLPARVYVADAGLWQPGNPWDLAEWQARWGSVVEATAADVMALYPQPIARARRYPMLVRGASRLRAAAAAAVNTLRRPVASGDVTIMAQHQPYAKFFAVEEYDLIHRLFDGNQGSLARGDVQPWQLEPIAGRIDPGETPEETAIREAHEEAGLTLTTLLPVANYYPSPGAKTEFLYSFVALTDLPDDTAIVAGLESEGEDIKGHVISFERLMRLVHSGEAATAPLILTALWLERERPRLRQSLA